MFILKPIFLITLFLAIPHFALAENWKIDPAHTSVEFKIKHLMISWVKGSFNDVKGAVVFDETEPENSSVNVQIATASVDTGNKKRDDHLRSPDFFDVASYPVMSFVSKKVTVANDVPTQINGELTLHGETRAVTLDVEEFSPTVTDPWGNTRRGASASTKINRRDFGLTWNKALEAGGVVVGEEVRISLEVELIKE
ncbi:MAG: polyisoprenoid-binding protein [Deltaproteobacteria bacterium]|nr:MAG: polyisoprenoid-binding protein [Deltaproteobacteria bacterium]